ncbi:S8 family serine peptidase [Flammeovirga pectinis]|nr:S8 family serine peptidase [Flammeovirga pectinis]
MLKQTVSAQGITKKDIVPQVIRVKLKTNVESSFLALKQSRMSDGTLQMGEILLDEICADFHVLQVNRVFPYSPKLEERHRKYGLHLWYEFVYSGNQDPSEVANAFKSYDGFEITKCVHQLSRPNEQPKIIDPEKLLKRMNTDDPLLNEQWHYNNTGQTNGTLGADISLLEAWETTMGSDQVIVAVMDGGIDYSHLDLEDNMWINSGEIPDNGIDDDNNGYIDDIYGYNFADGNDSIDPDNHGTHVGGTISASNNNGIGVAGVAGGNEASGGVRLMSCEVFSPNSSGGFAQAFVYAADNGALIAQNSWGYTSPGYADQEILDAIDYFIAEAGQYEGSPMQGGIVFFAAGNNDSDLDYYPGYYEPVVAVGATNHNNQKSWYSNYGDWVDVSAPGGETNREEEGVLSTLPNNLYGFYQGTSMACPHVSGIAALALSNLTATITNEDLRELLESSTDPLDNLPSQYLGKMGSGLLNAHLAVEAMPVYYQITPLDTLLILNQEGSITQTIDITNQMDTTLTLAFTTSESYASIGSELIVLQPNESESVDVILDGTGLTTGNYDLDIIVRVNDSKTKVLKWEVDVVTAPQMVAGSSLHFGSLYLGYGNTQYLEFVNRTYSYLTITDFETVLPDYIIHSDTLIVGPYQNGFLEVEFNPISDGDRSTVLTMTTNDPNISNYSVDLIGLGNGTTPPTIVVPDSIIIQHLTPVKDSITFDLINDGNDTLTYAIEDSLINSEVPLLASQYLNENLKKGEESKIQGHQVVYGFGNDTESEYTWIDSEESNSVVYDWIDLANDPEATVFPSNDDTYYTYIFDAFSFGFYDNHYNKMEISTNGTISFINQFVSFSYSELPNYEIGSNIIAPYWRDLVMNAIYVKEFNNYVVIQYQGYYYNNLNLGVEFEVILNKNGNIKYQYKETQETSYSVGMQKLGGTEGMTIAYNTNYLQDSLAIEINRNSFIESITPRIGDLAGQTSELIQINYNAEKTYKEGSSIQARVLIQTNDPATPIDEIFIEVQYGGPILTYTDSSFSLVSYIDTIKHDTLMLYNDGYLPLEINDITSSSSSILLENSSLTIAPKDSMALAFSFSTLEKNEYSETINFSTNESTNQIINIDLDYTIWNAYPHLVLNHQEDSLSVVVLRDSEVTQPFTLTNDGEDTVSYNISVRQRRSDLSTSLSLPKAVRPKQLLRKGIPHNGIIPEQFRREDFRSNNLKRYFEIQDQAAFGYLYDHFEGSSGYASILPEDTSSLTKYLFGPMKYDFVGAGEYISSLDKFIEFDISGAFYIIDPVTEEVSEQGVLDINNINGAAYDVNSDELYICTGSKLFLFNLENFSLTEIGTFGISDLYMISLSFDGQSNLYGIDVFNNTLLKIDTSGANVEEVGYIGFISNFGSGLGWDAANDRMVMASFDYDNYFFNFRQLDLQSGNSIILGDDLGSDYQFGWIAFQNQGGVSFDVSEGKLAPGDSQIINFTKDTNGMRAGDYLYDIEINSNDQLQPHREIPALISIVDLDASANKIEFDSVANGYNKTEELYIVNNSAVSIYVDSISITNDAYTVNSQIGLLQPQDSILLNVIFQPLIEGVVLFEGDLLIHFENVSNIIQLSGRSYDNSLPELVRPIEELVIEKNNFKVIDLTQHFYDINLDTIEYQIDLDKENVVESSIENNNQLVIFGKNPGVVDLNIKISDILGTIEVNFPVIVSVPDFNPPAILDSISELRFNLNSNLKYLVSDHFSLTSETTITYSLQEKENSILIAEIDDEGLITITSSETGLDTLYVVASNGGDESILPVPIKVLPDNEINKIFIGETYSISLDTLITNIEGLEYSYSFDTIGVVAFSEEDNLLNIYGISQGDIEVTILATNGTFLASLTYPYHVKSSLLILDTLISTEVQYEDSINYDLSQHFTYEGNVEIGIGLTSAEVENASFIIEDQTNVIIIGENVGIQTYTVFLTVDGDTSTLEFEVEVTGKNYSPEISQKFTEVVLMIDEYVIFDLNNHISDINGDSLVYSLGSFDLTKVDAFITNDQHLMIFGIEEGTTSLPLIVSDGKLDLEVTLEIIVNKDIISNLISSSSTGVKLYPNPATTITTILVEVDQPTSIYLNVTDLSGKKLFTKSWGNVPQGTFKHMVDVSNLVSGIYIISITSEDGKTLTKRLTIQ